MSDEITKDPNDIFSSLKMESGISILPSNFDRICRICFSTHKIESIFALKYNDTPLSSLLDSCVSIHVIIKSK